MRLNHDCIRDCLLYLEDHLELGNEINPNELVEHFNKRYSSKEVELSIIQLSDSNLINKSYQMVNTIGSPPSPKIFPINQITPSGYEYISAIYDEKNWKKITKKYGKKIIFTSLPEIVTSAITKYLS